MTSSIAPGLMSAPMMAACLAATPAFEPSVSRTPATGPSTRAASTAASPTKPMGFFAPSSAFMTRARSGSTAQIAPLSA